MERLTKPNELFFPLPLEQIQPLLNKDRFVLLETQKLDRENRLSYVFSQPVTLITCFNLDKISLAFQQLEAFLSQGYWAVGFFSYEMGYGWEDFKVSSRFSFPLIWLGVFKPPLIFDHRQGRFLAGCLPASKINPSPKYQIKDIRLNEKVPAYIKNIQRIKHNIAQGLTYQVNYTMKCKFKFQGPSFTLYKNLRDTQPVPYAAFIKDKQFDLLSFSPELFFRKKGRLITVRPMKGTISRGRTGQEDRFQMRKLKASQKDRSENIMIVDLLRNDLGKISEVGSVKVNKLYTVERYETLFQMTSNIQAKLKNNLSLYELFRSLFPSGSVTGAPKIRTMGIIRELEKQGRRVYTGAVGFFKPNRDAVFNVAIRTLLLRGKMGEMGIGSGIVYDSDPGREYKECELKALFFTQKRKQFQLIETIYWSKKTGFLLLPEHLERLRASAAYFNFCFNREKIKQGLKRISKCLNPVFEYRVRLLLLPPGGTSLSYSRIEKTYKPAAPKITLARRIINSEDVFLYHKTTNRQFYDQEYQKAKRAGFFDVIFKNERNEITEGAISNIFISKGKMYYTPAIACGLLAGIYRQYFIKAKAGHVQEKILRQEDLQQADAIYLTNAVRGITQVRL